MSEPNQTNDLRRQLGDFIRLHREQVTPESAGFPTGGRRRTPGLRREELAQLCRVSATWITWLEQGRDVAASAATLSRLAETLLLTAAERAYLFELAARADPEQANGSEPSPSDPVLRSVSEMICPAYVLDRRWDVVAANAPAQRLFLNWGTDLSSGQANLLRFLFLCPAAKALIDDWATRCSRLAAEFRADCGRYNDAPFIQDLVNELCMESEDFAKYWHSKAVLGREGGIRRFRHPTDGEQLFEQLTVRPDLHKDLKLVILLPVFENS